MASFKGQVRLSTNRVAEDPHPHRTGARTFKVYSENEKIKVVDGGSTRISVPVHNEALLSTASDSKGASKIVEKIKGKNNGYGVSVNQNVRRRALADMSNLQSSFSRKVECDGSKTMISAAPGSRIMDFSSRKSAMGKMKDLSSKRSGDFHATMKGSKDLKASADDQKTTSKNHDRESLINNSRGKARNLSAAMRKSLPVLKKVSQADATNAKESDESSEKAKRNSGFPVKVKTSKKVVPQVSMGRNHLWRNRVSDGFIMMAPGDQTNADARVFRKTVRPVVKTKIIDSCFHKTSRSKCLSTVNKSKAAAAILSKKKEVALTSSRPENIPVMIVNEVTQEPSSDSNSNSGAYNKTDVISMRKSSRRKSYTSLLMARSKLLAEHGEVIEQEKLPSIDDTFNQLEVAEYVDEIYQYYWVLEAENLSLENYMSNQRDITPQMRGIVINWLIEVHFKFELMPETLYLMVTLLDRYLSQVQIKKNELQLVGLTALFLASKYEDFWHPRIKDLISISAESYTRGQMLAMEKLFLKKLKFRLNVPTPYVFMLRFLKAAQSNLKLEHLAFYLIELCLVQYEALKFKPSMLCASAIYIARSTLQIAPAWTPLLARHALYQVSEIRDCAEMILRFQKAAKTSQLRVIYDKYMKPDLSGVAAIKPLDVLPLRF